MDTIKVYKLKNKQSGKVYRHMTFQNIMDKLHIGWHKTHDFISGTIQNKNYHKSNKIKKRLVQNWTIKEDSLPEGIMIKNVNGTFRKGISNPLGHKWSKGNNYRHPKGYRASPSSEFKKGLIPANFTGIGIPRILKYKRDGFQVMTTIDKKHIATSRGKKYLTKIRTSYARFVVGIDDIAKGHVVYHQDGDSLNNNISNLVVMSRAELIKINRGIGI